MSGRRGATTIEMTFVGIPLIFMLISTFEMSRGMWMYNTAATAVREGVRFATVHGVNCVQVSGVPNQCDVTANDIVQVIRNGDGTGPTGAGLTHGLKYGPTGAGSAGLPIGTTSPTTTLVTFTSASGSFTCKLDGTSVTPTGCTTRWPPDNDNAVKQVITISMQVPFYSAIAMFWPGSKQVSQGIVNLWASSSDTMQF